LNSDIGFASVYVEGGHLNQIKINYVFKTEIAFCLEFNFLFRYLSATRLRENVKRENWTNPNESKRTENS
jgi:hypothetical protein